MSLPDRPIISAAAVDPPSRPSFFVRRKKPDRLTRPRCRIHSKVKQRRQIRKSESMPNLTEYEALPSPLQQKYFSPTERFRFSQQSSEHKRKKLRRKGHAWLSRSSSSSTFRATREDILQLRRGSSLSSTSRLDQEEVTPDDAFWFLTLPEKVKRHHLKPEELVSFTECCQRTLDRSSPDPTIKPPQRQFSIDENTGLASICLSSLPCDALDQSLIPHSDSSSVHSFEAAAKADMQFLNLNHPRPISTVSTSAISNPSRSNTPPSSPPPEPSPVCAGKIFHARSLRPLNIPPPRLAPPRIVKSPSPIPSAKHATFRNFSRPRTAQSLSLHPSVNTTYTQDLETNKLVRRYLTTPDMIEASVEVPSTPPSEPTTPSIPAELPGDFPEGHTFWISDKDDSDDSDNDSCVSPMSPWKGPTPNDDHFEPFTTLARLSVANEYHQALAHCGSIDSGVAMSSSVKSSSFSSRHRQRQQQQPSNIFAHREKLMHILPSRAECSLSRQLSFKIGDDKALQVGVQRPDPLALEALPICDDVTGAKGAFAVREDTGFKRVWRSLRRH